MAPDALLELATYADLRGLDWQTLNAQQQGILSDSQGYLDVLEQRWAEFYAVAETLAITDAEWELTTAKEAADAWKEARDALAAKAAAMVEALHRGQISIAYEHAATLWSTWVRKLIIAGSHVSHHNLTAHDDGTILQMVQSGAMTVPQAELQASAVAQLWDCIVKLDQWNALSSLKKPEYGGTAGLGAAAAAEAAAQVGSRGLPIVIGALAVAAVVAAVIVFLAYLSDRNEQIDKFCFMPDGSLRPDRPAWCDQPSQGGDPLAVFLGPAREFAERLGTGLSVAVGVVGVVWVGMLMWPRLAAGRAAA